METGELEPIVHTLAMCLRYIRSSLTLTIHLHYLDYPSRQGASLSQLEDRRTLESQGLEFEPHWG